MPTIRLPNNWDPRDYQLPAWKALEGGVKRAMLAWHRRAGKDDVCLHWAATQAMQRVGTYWHMLPEYSQARKAIWEAVNPHTGKRRIDEAFPEAIRERTNSQEMFIRFKNGSSWQLVGSDNFNSLVGSPPIGITASEWALANPSAWAYLRPILKENGGWALFIFTPRGNNHAKKMYDAHRDDPEWFCQRLTVDDTGRLTKEEQEQELADYQAELGPEDGRAMFEQEYFCSWDSALVGSYYASLIAQARHDERITRVPYEPGYLVHTGWDLGRKDTNPVWFFQVVGREIRVIDYLQNSGVGPDWYVSEMNKKGYAYGNDYCPHDVNVTDYTATGDMSRKAIIESLGRRVVVVPQTPKYDQISAVRKLLPQCVFDAKKTEQGVDGLANFRREWDDKRKTFHDMPVHDWASHPSDAFYNVAYGASQVSGSMNVKPPKIQYRSRITA